MDPRFSHHNTHLINPKEFADRDPQLRYVASQPYVYHSPLIAEFPLHIPGVYTLSGGRQIGKTTLLKQWMLHLLQNGVNPRQIAFLSGELIQDHYTLIHLLQRQLEAMPSEAIKYLILDEVTYIKEWDKGIKYAKDAGMFDNTVVFLTGSDTGFLKEARMRFPGRRGKATRTDFHFYPLSFRETVFLKRGITSKDDVPIELLYQEFQAYLVHGGFMTAINDIAQHNAILASTLTTYSDWIRGDILKRGKHERYLREIILSVFKRYGSQVTWHSLAKEQSIEHPQTIIEYISLLEEMDALYVQQALVEDELAAAPKKARKVYVADPFIYHALYSWIHPENDPYNTQIKKLMLDPTGTSQLVEACVVTHFRRYWPTYYIKGNSGEVDVAYVKDKKFWPVEVKWTNQIHSHELQQLEKYKNGLLLTKRKEAGLLGTIPTAPLPLSLFQLHSGIASK